MGKGLTRQNWLILLSIGGGLLFLLALWKGWGLKSLFQSNKAQHWVTPEVWAKLEAIRPLRDMRGSRPFTPREMALLRRFVRDSDWQVRIWALCALAFASDPQQRKEAIWLARERLKDSEWVVREYAIWALGKLGAKEAVPDILPFLNDPRPGVREEARKALNRLGYQVQEEQASGAR